MNLSLKNRISASFIIANAVVLIMGFTVFFYLDSLSRDIEIITEESNRMIKETDLVRLSAVRILKGQQDIRNATLTEEQKESLLASTKSLSQHLDNLEERYQDMEVSKKVSKTGGHVDSLKTIIETTKINRRNTVAMANIGDLTNQILEGITEFLEIQLGHSDKRESQAKAILAEMRRNMLITLIITFLGTILLSLVIPGKIALPFKKISDAVRELQDNNFDVSIFYEQDDEIGELAEDINSMITSIKKFDELRTERIGLEQKKFDALANLAKKNVLVANSEGEISYMNNQLYSLLGLESDDVIHKNISDTLIADGIKDICQMAIKRRAKIENQDIVIYDRKVHQEEAEKDDENESEALSSSEEESEQEDNIIPHGDEIFKGYATVIPIRGKDSSLDYYLMVLTEEMID